MWRPLCALDYRDVRCAFPVGVDAICHGWVCFAMSHTVWECACTISGGGVVGDCRCYGATRGSGGWLARAGADMPRAAVLSR